MKALLKIARFIFVFAAIAAAAAFISERIDEIKNKGADFLRKPSGFYERFVKRPLDCFLGTGALIVLSPVLLVLTAIGAVKMKGNPFFTQERPGRIDPRTGREKIFRLVKFRSMTNEKDENGELLPDEMRLHGYGKALRASSLDELPELINIIKGDMAIVGPRPMLVKYLPYYSAEQRRRHEVRSGLTGYAQAHGRNAVTWEKKFEMDVWYVDHLSFRTDLRVCIDTVKTVLKREGISGGGEATMSEFLGTEAENAVQQ